jgi:DNA polymerase-4
MPSRTAYRLCPHAVFVRGSFDEYIQVSREIGHIFNSYTDLVEPLSLDEAFLDVTINKRDIPSATIIAQKIRKEINETTELTASAGVSYNKFLAKIASDFNKPNGITVVTPDMAESFIDALPIGKFHGIGKVTEKKMNDLGIHTGADLKRMSRANLEVIFGKVGHYFYKIAHGLDDRPVVPSRVRKSIGKEITLAEDIDDFGRMEDIIGNISLRLSTVMEKNRAMGKTITLKVKYFDFTTTTRSITIDTIVRDPGIIKDYALQLLGKTEAGEKKVRLLGVSVSSLVYEGSVIKEDQLYLPFH